MILYRICVENEGWTASSVFPVGAHWYYGCALLVVPTLWLASVAFGILDKVPIITHSAMYGGLFSSTPFGPSVADPLWAHRSSPEQIADAVAAHAMQVGASRETHRHDVGEMYAQLVREEALGAQVEGADPLAFDAEHARMGERLAAAFQAVLGVGGLGTGPRSAKVAPIPLVRH